MSAVHAPEFFLRLPVLPVYMPAFRTLLARIVRRRQMHPYPQLLSLRQKPVLYVAEPQQPYYTAVLDARLSVADISPVERT